MAGGDRATPNLPSRDFTATAAFYARLGFEPAYRGGDWMVLRRGGLVLEFFPHAALDPAESWFSCCLRLDDLATFYATCRDAGVDERAAGLPRLRPPETGGGLTMAALLDPDGSLLRLIQN